jgi:hypothetical protein
MMAQVLCTAAALTTAAAAAALTAAVLTVEPLLLLLLELRARAATAMVPSTANTLPTAAATAAVLPLTAAVAVERNSRLQTRQLARHLQLLEVARLRR